MKSNMYLFILFSLTFSITNISAQQKSVVAKKGAVVSVDEFASKAGVAILKKGGNAVDAAVATAFVLAVTYPQAGNIGGGGFMLIRMKNGESAAIDYREKAPMKSHARMFLNSDGSVDTVSSNYGYLVAGIPGTVRGLEAAWKKYGKLPWKELVMPAVILAENGFKLSPQFADYLESSRFALSRFDETKRVFFKANGDAYRAGERLIQKDLARTLRIIAEGGALAFYEGALAEAMVADVSNNGGIWTEDDLKDYQAVIRKPIVGTYRGYEILGMPPPSSAGVVLTEILNILENFELKQNNPESLHIMIESMRLGFFDRIRFLGDADFAKLPTDKLMSKQYAKDLAKTIDKAQAMPSVKMSEDISAIDESMETTHFSVVDMDGNVVSNTYTIEEWFGSGAVVKGLGFLLNNEMHDFNIQPDVSLFNNQKGNSPNLIEPGKRMLSSMAPTIVLKNGKPVLITGSPGGKTIINTVLQVIIGVTDYRLTLREAIDGPRLNHNWMPDRVTMEKNRWDAKMADDLKSRGHNVTEVSYLGDAHSIWIDPVTGVIYGEADMRRYGWAEGY
ncbi:gamma-glutamyltransferase [bacterium]|nr:gamma-glutamyltransferase [bacterium]